MKTSELTLDRHSEIRKPAAYRKLATAISLILAFGAGQVLAQEPEVLNPVLDVETLYAPLVSEEVYGNTAAELLAELEEKQIGRAHV